MRNWYGFALSLTTAVLWGCLPIALKLCLQVTDSATITWYRFSFAALFVGALLVYSRGLPSLRQIGNRAITLVVLAAFALVVNYVANVEGLEYVSAETVTVVMQLAPFLLMLGGVAFFGERLNRIEILGVVTLLSGLAVFFSPNLDLLISSLSNYSIGVLIVILGAVTWAAYALMQKDLLRILTAKQLTMMIYVLGAIILSPFVNFDALLDMSSLQLWALLFACFNTIIAYGAFTEALRVWQASKVSAVIALSPVFTFISMKIAVEVLPEHFTPSTLYLASYVGALLVVCGSMTAAIGRDGVQRVKLHTPE